MTSDISRIDYNTRERLTSGDLNGNIATHHGALQDAMAAMMAPDFEQSGVINGFQVSVDSVSRVATVSGGLGLIKDLTKVHPDSTHRWIQLLTSKSVTIPAGTGFARWDVIEVRPNIAPVTSQVRDIWDPFLPPSGGFTPQTVPKVVISEADVVIRAGASNAPNPPNFPAGTPGAIPIAYVYVDAAGAVAPVQAGIVMCRPILRAPGGMDVELTPYLSDIDISPAAQAWVQGGGVRNFTASSSQVSAVTMSGRFPLHSFGFHIPNSHPLSDLPNTWVGGASPVASGVVYAYAAPPPYPAGYDAPLAPREIKVGALLSSLFQTVSSSTSNCITVLDTTAPDVSTGAVGSSAGDAEIYDWAFRTGTTPATIPRQKFVYIGACDYDGSDFMAQDTSGDRVSLLQRHPTINFEQLGDGTYDPHTFNWPTAPPLDAQGHIPSYADNLDGVFRSVIPGAGSPPAHVTMTCQIEDDEAVGIGSYKNQRSVNVDAGTPEIYWQFRLKAFSTVDFTIFPNPLSIATGIAEWRTISYIDPILALR